MQKQRAGDGLPNSGNAKLRRWWATVCLPLLLQRTSSQASLMIDDSNVNTVGVLGGTQVGGDSPDVRPRCELDFFHYYIYINFNDNGRPGDPYVKTTDKYVRIHTC